MLRDDMKDCSILHRAGCLLYLEILSPLHVIPESHTVDDPTVPDKYRTRATGHQHGGIFDISSSSSPTSPATRNVPELASAEGARSPVAAELQVTQRHFGDEGISSTVSAEGSREEYNDAKRGVDRKHHHHQMVHSKTLVRGIQLENANLVIESGGLLALLSSFQGYARPGCEVDSKGQVCDACFSLFNTCPAPSHCHPNLSSFRRPTQACWRPQFPCSASWRCNGQRNATTWWRKWAPTPLTSCKIVSSTRKRNWTRRTSYVITTHCTLCLPILVWRRARWGSKSEGDRCPSQSSGTSPPPSFWAGFSSRILPVCLMKYFCLVFSSALRVAFDF